MDSDAGGVGASLCKGQGETSFGMPLQEFGQFRSILSMIRIMGRFRGHFSHGQAMTCYQKLRKDMTPLPQLIIS